MKERLKEFHMTCPECGHGFDGEFNTAVFEDSIEREEILKGTFAQATCPERGHEFVLNYRFVYTDDSLKFMIINDPNFVDVKNRIALRSSFKLLDAVRKNEAEKFEVILTTEINDLREKIILMEAGLSIRATELMKYILLESDDLSLSHDQVASFRYGLDESFDIQTRGGDSMKLPFLREIYEKIYDQYSPYFEEKAEVIDAAWAFDFLKNIK